MEKRLDDIYTQTHGTRCGDTTIQAGADHKLNREKYLRFFEDECDEFHHGVEETDLEGSHINCVGNSYYCPGIIGTYWTALEKEKFFWALGRYGIKQVDRIQRYVPGKSVLEIQNYYEVLRRNLEEYQRDENKRAKLALYGEIPEAVEVDEVAIEVEEILSSEEATTYEEPPVLSDRQLVDGQCLKTICETLNLFQKKSSKIIVDVELHKRLSLMARRLTRRLIREVLKTKIHNSIISRAEASLSQEGHLSVIVNVRDIHRAWLKLGINRPFARFPVLKGIYVDHFGMKKAKADEDSVELFRNTASMTLFRKNEEMDSQVEDHTLASCSFDVNGDQEEDDEELLLFISETLRLNEEYDRNNHDQVLRFMGLCGGLELYLELIKERSQELQLKRSIDYTAQDYDEVEAEMHSRKRIKMEKTDIEATMNGRRESQGDEE